MTALTYDFASKTCIREMINLHDPGNILIQGEEQYEKLKWMIIRRILSSSMWHGEVHFRFRTPEHMEADMETLHKLAAASVKVIVWGTLPELESVRDRFDTVVLQPHLPIVSESFIVATFNDSGRTLVSWSHPASEDDDSTEISGVFATDPDATAALLIRLHNLLESR